MVFVVAVAAPWGDFRRGEEAGDAPRGQRTCLGGFLRCRALRGCSAANLEREFGLGRFRAVRRVAQRGTKPRSASEPVFAAGADANRVPF